MGEPGTNLEFLSIDRTPDLSLPYPVTPRLNHRVSGELVAVGEGDRSAGYSDLIHSLFPDIEVLLSIA